MDAADNRGVYELVRKIFTLLVVFAALCFGSVTKAESVSAKAWIVSDENGKIIDGKNTTDVRSIASITKLVTVMVVLDAKQDLEQKIGKFTRKELIQLALVKSDNNAAKLLCDHYPGGVHSCIMAMNMKMHFENLTQTRFIEPTGLSVMNVSTAEELIKVVIMAKDYPEIVESSRTPSAKIQTSKKTWFTFNNTNPIIGKKYDFIVSKTGFISAAGGCIVMMLNTGIHQGIVILLGSQNTKTRIPEADKLVQMYLK